MKRGWAYVRGNRSPCVDVNQEPNVEKDSSEVLMRYGQKREVSWKGGKSNCLLGGPRSRLSRGNVQEG